jgi:transposase
MPELEGGPEMTIVAGFDVHRTQITFDALDTNGGEVKRGRIDATPTAVEHWVGRFAGHEVHVALEACTGWLFVSRALEHAGATPHLAEPVETHALRGRKRRAKTDREDARWLRQLLGEGRLPESWMPPEHVREWRSRARLRKTLVGERTQWLQRIQATLFHHGIGGVPEKLNGSGGREFLDQLELPADARERIDISLAMVDSLEGQLRPLEAELRKLARRQTGCRALMELFGMGNLPRWSRSQSSATSSVCRRRARPCGWPGSTSACTAPTDAHAWASSTARARRTCAGRSTRRCCRRVARGAPTTRTTSR